MKKKRILSLMAAAAMTSSLMCSAVAPAYAVNMENIAVANKKKSIMRYPSADILYGEISRKVGYFSSSDETSFAETLNGMIMLYNEDSAFEPSDSEIKFYCEEIGGYVSTPQELYEVVDRQGRYELEIDYHGETVTDADGEPFKFIAYIGKFGDVNLDGVVNAVDASNIRRYYSAISTGTNAEICPESQNPALADDNELENLCAFLADVNCDRLIDAIDASVILINYAEKLADGYTLSNDITNGYSKEEIQASSVKPHLNLQLSSSSWISDDRYGYYYNGYDYYGKKNIHL